MWPIDPKPFSVAECSKGNIVPLSHWSDYPYTIESEDPSNGDLTSIDPGRLTLGGTVPENVPLARGRYVLRLGGRAIRTLWQKRAEIPEDLWQRNEETLPYTGARVSFFCIDGLRLLNPHGVLCTFYFTRFSGEISWGITPIRYVRGYGFQSLILVC